MYIHCPPPRPKTRWTITFINISHFRRSDAKHNRHHGCFSSCARQSDLLTPPPLKSQVINMDISPPPPRAKKNKKNNNSDQETYRRPDAKHICHQKMLLQLCLEIRPPNPPPPPKFPSNKDGNQNTPLPRDNKIKKLRLGDI